MASTGSTKNDGLDLRRADRRVFRAVGGPGPLLREPDGQGTALVNWIYCLSGAAALVVFVYLIVALFKPEYFE